ncbi:hypothetical protein EJB05_40818, partial [Eragrostis curvula]
MPPLPPVLMEDLVEEILLRLPPNDPVPLFRTALVCKDWCCLIAGSGFRRRFREIHRMAPILGFPLPERIMRQLDRQKRYNDPAREDLVVWNPITVKREVRRLPVLHGAWTAALVCATAGCNHVNCDNGPFSVACARTDGDSAHACVYSSEKDVWSKPSKQISVKLHGIYSQTIRGPPAHVGNAVFFELIDINMPVDPDGNPDISQVTKRTRILACHPGWTFPPYVFAVVDRPEIAFLMMVDMIFTVDIKSGGVVNVYSCDKHIYNIVPYMSFCTPVLARSSVSKQVKIQEVALKVAPERLKVHRCKKL